jgi:hypothetical protein
VRCARLPDQELAVGVFGQADDVKGDLIEIDDGVRGLGEAAGGVVEGPDFAAVGGGESAGVGVGLPGAVGEAVFEGEVAQVGEVDVREGEVEIAVGGFFAGDVPDFTGGFPGVEEDGIAGLGGLVVDEELHDGPPGLVVEGRILLN